MTPPLARTRSAAKAKPVGRGPAPLRVARWEMDADVAVAARQKGVGEGVQHHIAVGMCKDASIMGNPDAAEPDMVAVPKGVDVKPRAGARDHAHRSRSQPPLSLVEIGSARQFDVGGIAHEHGHGEAGPLGESAIIGEAVEPEFGRLSVGVQDRL